MVTDATSSSYVGHFSLDQLVRSASDSAPGVHIAPKEVLRMMEAASKESSGSVSFEESRNPPCLTFRSPVDVGLSHRIDVHVRIDCLPVAKVDGLPGAECRFLSEVVLRPLLQMNHALVQVLARLPGMNDSRWARMIADPSIAAAYQCTSLTDSQPTLTEPLRQVCTAPAAVSQSPTAAAGGTVVSSPSPSAAAASPSSSTTTTTATTAAGSPISARRDHSVYVASPEEVHRKRMREEEEAALQATKKKPNDNEKQKLIRKALL